MELNEHQLKEIRKTLLQNSLESRILFDDIFDHFCCLVEDEIANGAVFETALSNTLQLFSKSEIENTQFQTYQLLEMEKTFSPKTALLASSPFLLFGLMTLYTTFENMNTNQGIQIFSALLCWTSIFSMFVLLGISLAKNSPRWGFSSIGFCLLMSLALPQVGVPFLFDNKLLGVLGLLPLIITLLASIAANPDRKIIRSLLRQIKEEKSTLFFMLWGTMPLIYIVSIDEAISIWDPKYFAYLFVSILTSLIITTGVNFLYLREKKKRKRQWILGIGYTVMFLVIVVNLFF